MLGHRYIIHDADMPLSDSIADTSDNINGLLADEEFVKSEYFLE
jgi:hypothetical protein